MGSLGLTYKYVWNHSLCVLHILVFFCFSVRTYSSSSQLSIPPCPPPLFCKSIKHLIFSCCKAMFLVGGKLKEQKGSLKNNWLIKNTSTNNWMPYFDKFQFNTSPNIICKCLFLVLFDFGCLCHRHEAHHNIPPLFSPSWCLTTLENILIKKQFC